MRKVVVLETAKELLDVAQKDRGHNDKTPHLPDNSRLVFENDFQTVRLEAKGFELSSGDRTDVCEIIISLCKQAGLGCHIT